MSRPRLLLLFDAMVRAPVALRTDPGAELAWLPWDSPAAADLQPGVLRDHLPTGVLRERAWWPAEPAGA